MPTTKELFEQAESLPVQDRALVVDSLLRTLNQPDPDMDEKWARAAERRLAELRRADVARVPADEVYAKARERFRS